MVPLENIDDFEHFIVSPSDIRFHYFYCSNNRFESLLQVFSKYQLKELFKID